MILSLITKEHYMPMRLPDRREGFFSLKDIKGRELFAVEGDGNKWVLHETDLGRLPKCQQADLWSGAMLSVRIGTSMRNAAVFAEDAGQKYAKYARCQTPDNVEYTIGSAKDNDFICLNPYISSHHCKLACRNREWSVTDSDSQTGTFVNGKRIGPGAWKLKPGDLVSVLNQKFIVLPGLLAFNAQNLDVKAVKESVHILKVPPLPMEHPLAPEKPTVFFHRQTRFTDEISGKDFTVDAPPVVHNSGQTQETPALLSFGPTLLSGAAMLLSGVDLISGLGMLANSVLFPKLEQRQNNKQQQDQEGQRRKYYTEYLDKLEKELQELHDKQTEMLRKQTPDPAGEAEKLLADRRSLWSRRPEHRDFLNLRMGLGSIPVLAHISFPDKTFETKDDPLQQKLEEFQRKPRLLRDVPIVLELKRFYSIGISGEVALRSSFAAQIIAQLAMHIGYDDMKLCILGPLYGPLAPLKWLPHTWNDEGILHFTAGNREEVDRLVPILDSVLEPRRNRPDSEKDSGLKEFIVLITDANLAQSGVITRLLFDNSYDHVHIITLADHSTQLHSRSDMVIGIKEKQGRMVWQEETKRQMADFTPDHGIDSLMPRLAYMMANTFLDIRAESASMPDILPFLDMFGVRDVRQLNILDRWEHAEPVRTLRTPLGISEDGTLCMLDIHNKGDGVHGLIAGTTGSGKSELIMSYILSMAVNYSPRDVAFVLIDYKGGGMANAFAGLPHTVGVITNLDGSTLQRSLVSIDSENKRRQRLFAETQKAFGMSKMEIEDYQQLYRAGKVTECIPHLLIITDEFAELKTQEPEFMEKLISAARIGRSLGVHLLLATQQPAGVVDDQIMTNTHFRLCLRMASTQDSQSILKSPVAAELKKVGSFYKQVGSVLTQAQSAYTGADYTPGKEALPICGVEILDHSGAVVQEQLLPVLRRERLITQASAVTQYITDIARREGIAAKPLWQPVLEEHITLSTLYERYQPVTVPWTLTPVLGELDDPRNQERQLVCMPLSDGKNTIVYGGIGSGKIMLLSTVLEDLLLHHTPEELNIYLLDYADDGLSAYCAAPHVGDVVTSDDDEKFGRLLAFLEKQVTERKKKLGGAMTSVPLEERLRTTGTSRILVVIHHLANLRERMEPELDRLVSLMRTGPHWGISFLATQETVSGMTGQLGKCFAHVYTLQMDQDDDYAAAFGVQPQIRPSDVQGRGLIRVEDGFREFQTASPEENVTALCKRLLSEWNGASAAAIRIMPERVTREFLVTDTDPSRPLNLPIGLDPAGIEPVLFPFDGRAVHILLGKNLDVMDFLRGLTPLAATGGIKVIALDPNSYLSDLPGEDAADTEDLNGVINRLYDDYIGMRTAASESRETGLQYRLIILAGVQSVLKGLNDEEREYLREMLAQVQPAWGWTFLLCDTPQNFNDLRYAGEEQSWYNAAVSNTDGLYLGSGITSQMVLRAEGDTRMLYQNIAYPLGYVVQDTVARRIQFVEEG